MISKLSYYIFLWKIVVYYYKFLCQETSLPNRPPCSSVAPPISKRKFEEEEKINKERRRKIIKKKETKNLGKQNKQKTGLLKTAQTPAQWPLQKPSSDPVTHFNEGEA